VRDFAEITRIFEPVRRELDHGCLNDVAGLENPTSESIAVWLWERLAPQLPGLWRITVHESPRSRCRYHGPGGGGEGRA
jgi:6-pyruvoyltetrahydropterin/6-carboxytetrahydropterin synthase